MPPTVPIYNYFTSVFIAKDLQILSAEIRMTYNSLTVPQLKQNLKKRGVEMPVKFKKVDLIALLVEEDAKLSSKKPATFSDTSKSAPIVPPVHSSGNIWVLETEKTGYGFATKTIVGAFSTKQNALKNAKNAFVNMGFGDKLFDTKGNLRCL